MERTVRLGHGDPTVTQRVYAHVLKKMPGTGLGAMIDELIEEEQDDEGEAGGAEFAE
jgi:hypothetical protein